MNAQTRIVKNSGILMGMELGIKALDVVISVLLARYLAPQGFGLLAFALAFVSLFGILPSFGMNVMTIRDLGRDAQDRVRYFINGLIAKASLSAVTLLLIGLITWALGFPGTKQLIVVLAGSAMILETTLRFTSSFFHAAQRMGTVAMINLIHHGAWAIAAVLVVWLRGGLVELLATRVLASVLVVCGSVWLIHRKLERVRWSFEPAFAWRLLKASAPFALFRIFVSIYVEIDMVMLSMMRGDVLTGWYAAAQKFRKLFTFIPISVSGAMLPAMAKFSKDSPTDLFETLGRSCKYLTIIALPLAAGISVLADRLVAWLYGPAYLEAAGALRILIWTLVFSFLNTALSSALMAVNRERQVSWCLGLGALFNIMTNLIAIPRWGHVGAAATTVLSEAVVLLVQLSLLRRVLPQVRPLGQLAKPLGATLAMTAFAWFGRGLELVVTVLGSAAVYATALVVCRAIGQEEWALINGILRRKGVEGAS